MKEWGMILCGLVLVSTQIVTSLSVDKMIDLQESNFEEIQTIKSELAYHEAYLRSLDNNATRDRKLMKQSKETIDFIYNGLGGQNGWEVNRCQESTHVRLTTISRR